MSRALALKFGNKKLTKKEMRDWCKRPGKMDEDGNPIYFTEQHHKKECDVNEIIRKYDKTGLISHVSRFEGQFGDLTQMDFKEAQDLIINSKRMFDELPSKIRKRFDNDPGELLKFMENPDNRQEAIELGIIQKEWTEETDGLGEHVKVGENVKKEEVPTAPTE